MATTAKPQCLPTIDLSSTGVGVRSLLLNDTDIVAAGDPLWFQFNPLCHQASRGGGDMQQRAGQGEPSHREHREWYPVQAPVISHSQRRRRRSGRLQRTAAGHHRCDDRGPVRGAAPFFSLGKEIVSKPS
jgi:hypothetical protein